MPEIIEALIPALGWLGIGGAVALAGEGVNNAAQGVGQATQQVSNSIVPLLLIGGGVFLLLAMVKK